MSGGANAALTETIITAFFSSTGAWGILQYVLSRRQRKEEKAKLAREESKLEEKDRQDQERRDRERVSLLAESQALSQRTALESANARYTDLHSDYVTCRDGLRDLREATSLLLFVFDNFLGRLQPTDGGESYNGSMSMSELGEARRAINDARRHLR